MTIEIVTADCRAAMREMAAESVQCVVTSPPYWGLREYEGVEPVVWDGDADCEHEWGEDIPPRPGRGNAAGDYSTSALTNPQRQDEVERPDTAGAFCRLCGAWLGVLGNEPTIDLYVQHMVEVFREVWRVLRADGTVWLNLGDSYAASAPGNKTKGVSAKSGLHGVNSDKYRETLSHSVQQARNKVTGGLKPKDLIGVPWRCAFALQADGWWLRSAIVWAKGLSFCPTYAGSVMPESCTDRPTSGYEMVFLLAKSGRPLYWTHRDAAGTRLRPSPDFRWVHAATGEEVMEAPADWRTRRVPCPDCEGTGYLTPELQTALFGSVPKGKVRCERCKGQKPAHTVREWPRVNLWSGHDYYYDHEGVREASISSQQSAVSSQHRSPAGWDTGDGAHGTVHRDGREQETSYNDARPGRNLRDVWAINPQNWPKAHFATFSEELVEPCIKAGSSPQACGTCGAPWERVVETHYRNDTTTDGRPAQGNTHKALRDDPGMVKVFASGVRTRRLAKTTGWRPTCEHQDDTGRSAVLDPFGGSGTVGLVAKRLGRDALIIDASAEYCEMARERCATDVTREMFT